MSWFFGKKKHKDSPPETPEEEGPPPDEGFIFVEKRNQSGPDADDKTPSLYPSLNISSYPSIPIPFTKQNSQDGHCNDLSCIPFKLSKELERSINDDLVIDKLRLDEILSFIKRVKLGDYDYEFTLERSVIAEMDSQNEEYEE